MDEAGIGRPRTSPATRSAATSRSSSPPAAGRAPSPPSRPPAAGRATTRQERSRWTRGTCLHAGAAGAAFIASRRRPPSSPRDHARHTDHVPPDSSCVVRGALCVEAPRMIAFAADTTGRSTRRCARSVRLGHRGQAPAVAGRGRALPARTGPRRLDRPRRRGPLSAVDVPLETAELILADLTHTYIGI